ncbi:MAG: ATP synthase F0 subunit C [Candidatus Magnetominusculus sp. LBB02]|nr:ATP synthase F0 subunit C [Candidatus Magnetominusculus sp. LBB02]
MSKGKFILVLSLISLLLPTAILYAETSISVSLTDKGLTGTGAVIGISIAAFGASIGQSIGLFAACNAMARNPKVCQKVTSTLIVGLAMIESLCIYAFLLCLGLLINQKMFF